MIGVQYEKQVERFDRHRIDLIRLGRHSEQHLQQVFTLIEVIPRIDKRLSLIQFVRSRSDRRQLR